MSVNDIKSNKTYTNLYGDHLNNVVVFGDDTDKDNFCAHVKMEFWGEDWLSIFEEGTKGISVLSNEVITLEDVDKKYEWFQHKKITGQDTWQSQLKWVRTLKKKPPTNKWILKLAGWEKYRFCYQTPLSEEALNIPGSSIEYLKVDGVDHIRLNRPAGGVAVYDQRPLDIDGSYAVYHKTKRDNIVGRKNYYTGKVLHIHRSKAVDADNKFVWVDLHIENGFYIETISQAFLDNAKYPIRINATLGLTTKGAASTLFNPDWVSCSGPWTAPEDGTVTSYHWYISSLSNTPITLGLYEDDTGSPKDKIGDSAGATENTDGWVSQNVDDTPAITNGTAYWPGQNHDDDQVFIWYDIDVSYSHKYTSQAYSGGNLIDPHDGANTEASRKVSFYITYTPGVPTGMSGAMTTNTGYWGW